MMTKLSKFIYKIDFIQLCVVLANDRQDFHIITMLVTHSSPKLKWCRHLICEVKSPANQCISVHWNQGHKKKILVIYANCLEKCAELYRRKWTVQERYTFNCGTYLAAWLQNSFYSEYSCFRVNYCLSQPASLCTKPETVSHKRFLQLRSTSQGKLNLGEEQAVLGEKLD